MNANDFVAAWHRERNELLARFTDTDSQSETARLFDELDLDAEQRAKLAVALRSALTDTLYTLLLGLDGAANIGGMQEQFLLSTANGDPVGAPGEIEVAAYEYFHEA